MIGSIAGSLAALVALQPASVPPATLQAAEQRNPGGFHPIDGQRYRYTVDQLRIDGAMQRRFSAERHVIFRKLGSGWRAEVVLDSTSHAATGEIGDMFEAAMAGLKGRPVFFDLDDRGSVLAIDDIAAVWAAAMDAIDHSASGSLRGTSLQAITRRMRTLPGARQTAILASMLTPVIDQGTPNRQPGRRAVKLPSTSPLGTPVVLGGDETLAIDPRGMMVMSTRAAATIALSLPDDAPGTALAPAGSTGTAEIRIDALRHIDPRTGLVILARDSSETCTPSPRRRCISTVTTTTLTTQVS